MNGSTKCKNCGADYALHQSETDNCPEGGFEAAPGRKQRWAETVFEAVDLTVSKRQEALDKAAQTAELFLRDLQELNRLSGVAESELLLIYIGEVARMKILLKRLVNEKTTVK